MPENPIPLNPFAFDDLLRKDEAYQQPISKVLPEYRVPESTPVNVNFPNTSMGGKQGISNPISQGISDLFNGSQSTEQMFQPINFDKDAYNVNRYKQSPDFFKLGLSLDGNNEEVYGQNQSWSEVLSNGTAGLGKLAYNGFVDGWKGWGRMTDALLSWDWEKIHGDEASMMELDNTVKQIMNDNAIYATQAGEETFWNRQTFGNFLQQSGFAIGAGAQMVTEQLITKALEAGLTMSVVGAPAAAAIEGAEDVSTAAKVNTAARVFGKSKEFFDAAKNFKALKKVGDIWKSENIVKNVFAGIGSKLPVVDVAMDVYSGVKAGAGAWDAAKIGLGGTKRLLSEANFAFTEARMEAASTYTDLMNQMREDYAVRNNGELPEGRELQILQDLAMKAADKNFNFNTGILAVSNRIQFDNIFKNNRALSRISSVFGNKADDVLRVTGKINNHTTTHYYEKGLLGGLGVAGKVAADFGKREGLKVAAKSIMKPLAKFELTEGIQELLQEGSNEYFKDLYMDMYRATYNSDVVPSSEKSLDKAIASQSKMQGLKTFMSGALTGMLISGPARLGGKALQTINDKATIAAATKGMTPEDKAKYIADQNLKKAERGTYFAEFNALAKDPSKFFSEAVKNTNIQKEGSSALTEAANADDKFAYENIRTDMLHSIITQAIKNDTYEGLIDTLQSYGTNMTKEEFEQAFVGLEHSTEPGKQPIDYVNKIVDSIQSYVQTREKLADKYRNIANPNRFQMGSKEWINEVIKQQTLNTVIDLMAGNEFKATDALNRMTAIMSTVAANKNFGPTLANSFNILGSEINTDKEITILQSEIKSRKEGLQGLVIPAPDRARINQEIKDREATLKALEDWKSSREGGVQFDWDAEVRLRSFKDYLNIKNKEAGITTRVMESDVEDSFVNLIDYLKLNRKSQQHVDAINFLANPDNFIKLHQKLQDGAKEAYYEMLAEAGKDYIQSHNVDNQNFVIEAYGYFGVYNPEGTLIGIADTKEDADRMKLNIPVATKEPVTKTQTTEDEVTDKGETFNYDTRKPLLAVTGLFTTTGLHYTDKEDTSLNLQNNNAQFYKFSESVNTTTGEYFVMPVTADNDSFGIRRSDIFADDIKLVVVKKVNGEFKYVDINGNVNDNPSKETLIYTSAHGNATLLGDNIEAAITQVQNRFTTTGLTNEEIAEQIAMYKGVREKIKLSIKSGTPIYFPVTGKSKGVQIYLPKTPEGLPQELNMSGRLIDENTTDFTDLKHPDGQSIKLVVATLKEGIGLDVKPGRAVMQKADGQIYRVFNRAMSDGEKTNLIELLKIIPDLLKRRNSKTNPLTRQESVDLTDIMNYLDGIVLWNNPESRDSSPNKLYIDSVNNLFYRGDTAFEFTPEIIELNKDLITEGLYHQINNALLKTNDVFLQVVAEKGKLKKYEYQNYVQYLISATDNTGKERRLGSVPVYSNLPLYTTTGLDPQLKSVYLVYQDPENPVKQKVIVKQSNTVMPADVATGNAAPQVATATTGFKIQFGPEPVAENTEIQQPNQTQPEQQKVDTKPTGGFVIQFGNDDVTDPQPEEPVAPKNVAPLGSPFSVTFAPDPAAPTTETAKAGVTDLMSKLLSQEYQSDVPWDDSMDDVSDKIKDLYRLRIGDVMKTENFQKLEAWFKQVLPNVPVIKVAEMIDGKAWGAFKNGSVYIYENAEEGTGFHEAFEAVFNAYLTHNQQQDLIQEFRKREGDFTNPFSGETKSYSQASLYDAREMMAEEFRSYILTEEAPKSLARKIVDFFKELWNTIKSITGLTTTQKAEVEDLINKTYKAIKKGEFANVEFARDPSLMGTSYRQAIPGTTQEFNTQVTEGLTAFFFMNLYGFKGDKTAGNNATISKNIDSLVDKNANTNKLLKDLFVLSIKDMHNYLIGKESVFNKHYVIPMMNTLNRGLSPKELETLYTDVFLPENRYASMIENVFAHPQQVYNNLKKSLGKFGLQFKEVLDDEEMALVEDKENILTDRLGIRDAITIDPRRLSSVNFRMLIGSLTNDIYVPISASNPNGIEFQRNSIGVPKLIDFDNTHNLLLNELNSTTSRFEKGQFKDALTLMLDKLDDKYKNPVSGQYKAGYVWIERLKRRLKYSGKDSYFTTSEISADDIRMLVGFEKSLLNKQNLPVQTIIAEDGYIYDTDPIQTSNAQKIREEWENNILKSALPISQKNPNDLLGIDDKGFIVIDRSSNPFIGYKDDNTKPYLTMSKPSFEQVVQILSNLGINFSAGVIELSKYKVVISQAYSAIISKIIDGSVKTMADLYSRNIVNQHINKLIEVEQQLSSEDNVLVHYTAEGQPQYSISMPSSITYVLSSLKDINTLSDFIRTNPQFGKVNDSGEVVLHPYQRRSLLLKQDGLLFDKAGNKRTDINYHLISGISAVDSDGTNTSDLTYPDRVMQEIHYLLRNIHYTIINSDKSTEFGLGMNKPFVTFRQAQSDINSDDFEQVMNIYRDQLEDEIDAALQEVAQPSGIQYYSAQVKKLGHFREILGESLMNDFTDKVLSGKMLPQEFVNRSAVDTKIRKHISDLVGETLQGLIDLDIIQQTPVGKNIYEYSTKAISNELLTGFGLNPNQMSQNDIESLVTFIALNKEIAVTEQHKMFYGHPVMYKDLAKRANGINSTKEAIVDNPQVIQWMDTNMKRFDGHIRQTDGLQTFKNISFKDVTAVSTYYKGIAEGMYDSIIKDMSKEAAEKRIGVQFDEAGKFKNFILNGKKQFTGEIKAYLELNEADAQAWIMPDMFRDMMFLSSKFSKDQARQWAYEMAYEVVARSNKRKSHPAYKEFSSEMISRSKEILAMGSPLVSMQILKPQYFGYAANDSVMQTVFLKHSAQPKFYRHVENTQYENLYLAAQNNKVDIIGFESGEKVGNMLNENGQFTPIYNDAGTINAEVTYKPTGEVDSVNLPTGMPQQILYTRYYGIQQEQPSMFKTKVVRGTQVTKLVMSNFYEDGVATSTKADELIKNYNDILRNMIRLGKAKLVKELGLKQLEDGTYATIDLAKMTKMLREELGRRDLPDNLLDAMDVKQDGQSLLYKFDTLANREKIDNILNSIVDSRVISEKMHGKASVQVASTGYESSARNLIYQNAEGLYEEVGNKELTPAERATVVPTSTDLKFYSLENGKITQMEVYLPWYFENITPEDMGLIYRDGVYQIPEGFDSRLLTAIGFRIPTQGMNSIENIRIKGFLPRENGDMIVVPTEMVGKSGSDFDIDKLNIYLPNYHIKIEELTNEEIGEFTKHESFTSLNSDIKKAFLELDNETVQKLIEDLNNFSVTSGKGKYGNLSDWMIANDMSDVEEEFYSSIKEALQSFNTYKRNIIKANKAKVAKPQLFYVEQADDTKEGLQNKFIQTMSDIVALPENYRQLVAPNGATTMKSLATEISSLKGEVSAENSFLALRKFIPMSELRERYLTGKRMVGIAALQVTSHTMAQVAGIKLTGTYDPKVLYYLFEGQRKRDINIRLRHNRTSTGELYLYAKKDQEGKWISENLSEALTGFVDAAKDPFVFQLNLSLNTAGTWFYLQKLGVPMQDIAYLFNQPVIDSYFKAQAKNRTFFKKANGEDMTNFMMMLKTIDPYMTMMNGGKSDFEEINNMLARIEDLEGSNIDFKLKNKQIIDLRVAIKKTRQRIAANIDSIRNSYPNVSTKDMRDSIKNLNTKGYHMTKKDAGLQIALMADYLEYANQAQYLTEFIASIGYDNSKTKTIIENDLQKYKWDKMLDAGFIANPSSILENTFVGELKKQKEDLRNLFQDFFISLSPKAQPVFEPLFALISNRELFMSKANQVDLINRYQNFFITYAIQNTPYISNGSEKVLSSKFQDLLTGAESLAKQLKYLKQIADPNISQNLVIRELLPILTSDTTQVDNIKLFKNKMDTYKNNILIESVENLQAYAAASGNTGLLNFLDNLTIFSILQSGLQTSGLNFTKVLPASTYSKLINEILENYVDKDYELNPSLVWRQFHQNNWRNKNIVPKIKFVKSKNKLDNTITLDESYSDAKYDYVTRTTLRNDISGKNNEAKRVQLLKEKKYDHVFETILYEKVQSGLETEKGIVSVYAPIDKLGDRYKFMETYPDRRPSILPQNNTVDPSTGLIQATYIVKKDEVTDSPIIPTTPVVPLTVQFGETPENKDNKDPFTC